MRRQSIWLLAGLLVGVSGLLAQAASRFEGIRQLPATEWEVKGGGPRAVWCPRAAKVPVLDGRLDDPCWKEAGRARDFIKADGGMAVEVPADYRTQVLLCRDDENFYMAWTVTGQIAKDIASSPTERFRNDIGNYKDCYSVAFKMVGGDNEYTFHMNSKGNTGAFSLREEANYKAPWSAKSAPTEDGAIIELAIPFSSPGLHAPKDGEWWQVQLNRVSNYEWSAHNIQFCAFDYLYFGSEKDFRGQSLPIPAALSLYGERYVCYRDDARTQFVAALRGRPPEGASVALQLLQGDRTLDEGLVPAFSGPYLAFLYDTRSLPPGAYRMQATLRDKAGVKVLEGGWPFTVEDKQETSIPFPAEGVRLHVHGQDKLADGVWPVSTGVPLPRGAVRDVSELALFEDGKPVPANLVSRATWFPTLTWTGSAPEARDGNSIKWVGVSFNARYAGGKPRTYALKKTAAAAGPTASRLSVAEDDRQFLIATGPMQLAVGKTAFAGVRAWLDRDGNGGFQDDEMMLDGGGPFLLDQDGKTYAASAPQQAVKPFEVVVEEKGPARVVVAVKGWYRSTDGTPPCMYHTRVIAFDGLPFFEVRHRTILTCDNRKMKLADSGFALRTPRPSQGAFGTMGDAPVAVEAQPGEWSMSLHQDRPNHFRLIREWQGAPAEPVGRNGRGDGLVRVGGAGFSVSAFLRDVWEKYPKELEVGNRGIVLHFWPRHGHVAFGEDELYGREHLHKLRYSHTGRLLDLQIPDKYLESVRAFDKTLKHPTDGPQECLYGYGSPGRGVAISNEFFVLLEAAEAKTPALTAGLVRQAPAAYADPPFACATGVFDRIRHQDLQGFPRTERALERTHLALYRFFENSDAWGMLTFAGYNTSHAPGVNYPSSLARLWGNSHYQEASAAWLQYFRSGNPEMLRWARAHSDHFMNIATCNYDDPNLPLIASNPDGTTKGFHVPMAGQQFHCKSPVPWGGPLAGNGHFIDPQSIYMRYCLEGDYAARDTFALWGEALKRTPVDMTPHRDTNCTLAHLLQYYGWSWDPYALVLIHKSAAVLHNTAFAKHGAGHFHKFWAPRYYDLTRDPKTLDRIKEWVEMVGASGLAGSADAPALALLYRQTGDRRYLPVIDRGPAAYDNPDDQWTGYSEEAFGPYAGFMFSSLMGAMHALAEAGLAEETASPARGRSPQCGVVFKDRSGQDADTQVLLVREDDRGFELVMENAGCNEAASTIRLLGADGKPVVPPVKTKYDGRYRGPQALRVAVPKGGAPGLIELAMRGGNTGFSFFMPASALDGEAAVLRPDVEYRLFGPTYCVSPQAGQDQAVVLDFAASGVAVLRMADANGAEFLNTSLAVGLKRDSVSVTVDPKERPLPWTLEVTGGVKVRARQTGLLYLAPDKKRLNVVLAAVAAQK